MSYAAVGVLGDYTADVCPYTKYPGVASGGPEPLDCVGDVRAKNCPDECCPSKTWKNSAYRNALGVESWQYWNERRARKTLQLAATSSRDFPTGAHEAAYDGGLDPNTAVPVELIDRLLRAAYNFEAIFPYGRWKALTNQAYIPACGDARFTSYKTLPLTAAQQTARDAALLRLGIKPKDGPAWTAETAAKIFSKCPYGSQETWRVDTEPTSVRQFFVAGTTYPPETYMLKSDRPDQVTAGRMTPSKWLAALLEIFAPPKQSLLSSAAARKAAMSTLASKISAVQEEGEVTAQDAAAGMSTFALLAASAVAVAAGFWLLRK